MPDTIASRFIAAGPLLTADLVDTDGLARLCEVGRDLPGALASNYVIETRLGEARRTADFAFRLDDGGNAHHVLAGRVPNARIAAHLLEHPTWQRITAFAREWSDGAPELRDIGLWLEFDSSGPREAASVPSVFFQPGRSRQTIVRDGSGQPFERRGAWDPQQLARVLARWEVSALAKHNLARCCEALPSAAGIDSVGVMLSRVPADLRLTISPFSPATLLAYLDAIEWRGAGPDFADFATLWPDVSLYLRLNIDVGEVIGPRISVESVWKCPPAVLRADAGWRGFVEELIARGLARPEKGAAVFRDAPYVERPYAGAPWPEDLAAMSSLIGTSRRSVFWRFPLHLKMGYRAGRAFEAKAYFSLVHLWVPYSV